MERNSKRKKTDRQIEAAEKRKAAEEAVSKTAKQIYLDLIRHFHPDREQDEQKRLEKTEIMKQITVAYDANDHLKLLELQMTLLADRSNVFADFSDSQLKYFNDVLKRQVGELEMELEMNTPDMNGNPFGRFYHPSRPYRQQMINRHVKSQEEMIKMVSHTLDLIQTRKGLKIFISDYELSPDMDDMSAALFDMMKMFR